MSIEEEIEFDISYEEQEESEQESDGKQEIDENHKFKYKNITPENISELKEYTADHYDDSENKWKTYLYEGIKGELRK